MKTISFDLAKRLAGLAVNQPSYFIWHKCCILSDDELPELKVFSTEICAYIKDEIYLAYTLDEILEMLPPLEISDGIYSWTLNGEGGFLSSGFNKKDEFIENILEKGEYGISYEKIWQGDRMDIMKRFINKKPAEAAGELLAWCIEEGHIKPEKIND
jgi:hypothetical protein